jgi:DNA-directed RNA polymerase II subunit RPB1
MQCVTQAKDSSVIERFSKRYSSLHKLTGKQLFSSLLPNGFHYKQRIQRDTGSEIVEVVNGELVSGRICKRSIGATSGGIIHCLTRVCGPEAAMAFLGDCQRVVGWWLSQNALSIGLGDCLISKSSAIEVAATVDHAVRKADLLGLGVTDERQIHKVDIAISSCLRKVVTQAGNAALRAAPNPHCNAFKDTVDSAAKGTIVNLTQVLCCVGQQNAQGKRIGFSDERTLPCFAIPTPGKPNSASARGFVSNSFAHGLSPPEMFFHLIASRDALMDTSVRTSLSGYGQRKMTKAAEDVTLKYDGTARHSNGTVVTFVYGSDGMDSAKLDPVCIPELQYDMKSDGRAGNDEVIALLLRECREERISIINGMPSETVYLPFNATQRLAQFPQPSTSTSPDDSAIDYARERLERLCRLLREKEQGARTLFRTSFLRLHLRLELGEQQVASRLRNTELIGSLFDNLEHLYFRACVEAGEAVGLLAAENIAEPLTQLVLNVFHTAGIAQVASTQGIPRLNELIDASRNIKTPTMTLFACPGRERDLPVSDLPEKPLDAFVKQAHVFHQPGGIYSTECMQHEDYSVDTENVTKMFLSEQRTVVNVTALLKRHLQKRYPESPEHHSPYAFVLILEDEGNVEDIARRVRQYLGSSQGSENRYIMECSAPGMLHQFIRVRITNSSDITDRARKDINDRFPAWGQKRVSQAVSELYHSMTHALLRKIMFNVRIGKMADVKESKLVSTNDNLSRYTGEPRITTSGSSLRDVWNVEEIDWKRSMTNDVIEVQNVLGIEAASTLLFHELREVITSGGSSIADRHISMIVSIMTCYGRVTPLTRYGDFRLGKNSAVVRASFEQQNAHIVDAGAFGEASEVVSLSDTIVVGCRPQMGTGAVTLLIDENYLQDCKKKAATCEEISSAGGGGIVQALLSSDDLVSRNSEKGLMEMFMKRGPKTSDLPWIKVNGHTKSVSMATEIENPLRVDPKDVMSQIDMERIAIPKTGGSGIQEAFEDVSIPPAHMNSVQDFHPSSPKITNIDTKAAETDMATKQLCELLNTLQPMILKFQLPLYSEEGELSMEEFDRLVKNVL